MKFKIPFLLSFSIFLFCLFAPVESSAQVKKRIALKRGAATINDTIRGDEIRLYVFRAKKNTDVDISIVYNYFVKNIKPHPEFILLKPDGKPFSDDSKPAPDMLDVLPEPGDYTIRVQLPENMRNGGKPVRFTLKVVTR